MSSPEVPGSRRPARTLVEARAPGGDLPRDTNPLLRNLRRAGLISEYVTTDPGTGEHYRCGRYLEPGRMTTTAHRRLAEP